MQQLDALAELVSIEELGGRPAHDVVKCMFTLGDDIDAAEVVQELNVLKLMSTPQVLSKTNQLLITETAAKLLGVQQILDRFRSAQAKDEAIVKSFRLQHVDAEDVLVVARPHLGLAPDAMMGIDISISSDLGGKQLFVTGLEDKIKLLEDLIKTIDQPDIANVVGLDASAGAPAELVSHAVEGGNVQTVYNVLQTILAGKDVRLSMDERANSVVALATPEIQREIAQTVQQLQASEADFEVIPLRTADPYQVISLLEELLDLPGPFDDPDEIDPDAPKIDADPGNRRLFVRAKRPQIEQIKKIVAGLDDSLPIESTEQLRVFPLRGSQSEQILESAAKFWRGENPVVLYRSLAPSPSEVQERVLSGNHSDEETLATTHGVDTRSQRWLTTNVHNSSPAIRCQLLPTGVLIQSDDTEAVDRFEQHLRTIVGSIASIPSPTIVYYLKYTAANDAVRMLSELLDGGATATESTASTLVNGFVSSPGSLLGSYVSSQEGTMTLTSGTLTIVADSRLNRLIAQGTTEEIDQIESYLRIIDKDNSITSVETHGVSHVIELAHADASDVAESLREAFAGRVIEGEANRQDQPPQPGDRPTPRPVEPVRSRDEDSRRPEDNRGGKSQPVRDLDPKMTIAVHEPSNSLIVTAPQQLFEAAEKLAKELDSRAEQTVQVITPVNAMVFESVLQEFLGQSTTTRSTASTTSSRIRERTSSSSSSSSASRGRSND
jgi:type II secretory pathway component GspD/PulD (secretin)